MVREAQFRPRSKPALRRKYQALEDFKRRLLESDVADRVGKILLFGSLAEGRADRDSDVDVLVFAAGDRRKLEDACADASYEATVEYGESVEPLIYAIEELRFPNSVLVKKAKLIGKEIYSMTEKEIRKEEAQNYLLLAEEYLESARQNLQMGGRRVAADAGYNAVELALKGLILLKSKSLPRRHGGILQRFSELYIKTGEVNRSYSRKLQLGFIRQNQARYGQSATITTEDGEEVIRLADEIIGILRTHLEKTNGETLHSPRGSQ